LKVTSKMARTMRSPLCWQFGHQLPACTKLSTVACHSWPSAQRIVRRVRLPFHGPPPTVFTISPPRSQRALGTRRRDSHLSVAKLGRERVEIDGAAGADRLDGVPPRRPTTVVHLFGLQPPRQRCSTLRANYLPAAGAVGWSMQVSKKHQCTGGSARLEKSERSLEAVPIFASRSRKSRKECAD